MENKEGKEEGKEVNLGIESWTLFMQLYELGVVRAISLTTTKGPVKIRYVAKLEKLLDFVKLSFILRKTIMQP